MPTLDGTAHPPPRIEALRERVLQRVASAVLALVLTLSHLWYGPAVVLGSVGQGDAAAAGGGDSLRQLAFVLLFVTTLAAVILTRRYRALLSVPAPLLPFLAWAWLSLFWAFEPSVALRRLVFTTLVILTIALVVRVLEARRTVETLFLCFAFIILADWTAVSSFPMAVHQAGEAYSGLELDGGAVGAWRGLHQEKNQAGAFGALALLLFLQDAFRQRSRLAIPILALLSLVLLWFTQSKTSLGLAVPALLVGGVTHVGFHNPLLRRVACTLALVTTLLAALWWGDLAAVVARMLDDPSAFTGRSQIWAVMSAFAADHPWLGSGYGSFWDIGDGGPMPRYASGWLALLYTAHSGYLDILVQTGTVGLVLTVLGVVVWPFVALLSRPLAPGVPRVLIASFLTFFVLHNILETSFFDRANPVWVVALVMYCLMFKPGFGGSPLRRNARATAPPSQSKLPLVPRAPV